jgi:hypothetical protein
VTAADTAAGFGGVTPSQVAANIALHGVFGGVQSKIGGGDFRSGFVSSLFTTMAMEGIEGALPGDGNYYLRITIAAMVGGTIEKVAGGKFANGAINGAYAQMFNKEAHREEGAGGTGMDYLEQLWKELFGRITPEEAKLNRAKVIPDAIQVSGAALGGSLSVTVDRNQIYFGAGTSLPLSPSVSAGAIYIDSTYNVNKVGDTFLRGLSYSGSVCYFGCFGLIAAPNGPGMGASRALYLGVGVGVGVQNQVTPDAWVFKWRK